MKRAARAVKLGPWLTGGEAKGKQAGVRNELPPGSGAEASSRRQPFKFVSDAMIKQKMQPSQDKTSVPDVKEPKEDSILSMLKFSHVRKKIAKNPILKEDVRAARREIKKENFKNGLPSTDRITTLHLFRSILREASYLPDPASRKYFQVYYTTRFRDYCPRNGGTKQHNPREIKRNTRNLREARHELRMLQKANAGIDSALTKVLDLTYGRRGKRKYELLKSLKPPGSAPINDRVLRTLSEAMDTPSQEKASKPNMSLFSPKFVALIKSQMRQKQDAFEKPLPKHSAPKIPETNTWGRPMPVKRVNNLTKKWYAETLERLMPPLPEAEWTRLGDLATGKEKWLGPPQRRARGTSSFPEDGNAADEEVKELRKELQAVARAREAEVLAREAHTLTPRYMRRMWADIYAQCPVMRWNGEKKKWDVKWGRVDEERRVVLSAERPVGWEAFEGVDGSGKVVET